MVARFASYFGRTHAVFCVGKYFVARLSTTKTTKILPPEKYPLYGIQAADVIQRARECLNAQVHSPVHSPGFVVSPDIMHTGVLLLLSSVLPYLDVWNTNFF